MTRQQVFPTILIVLSACAAAVYAMDDPVDWRKVVYWTAAAVLNISVTY